MTNPNLLISRYARRPQLITADAAEAILAHIRAQDPRGMRTEGRFDAFFRRLGRGFGLPSADGGAATDIGAGEEWTPAPPAPGCYSPLWAQQAYGEPDDNGYGWALLNGVAMMSIDTALSAEGERYCGTWYHGYDTLLAAWKETQADERVKARFVRCKSPGGVVAGGLQELSDYIAATNGAAGGKPTYFYTDMACSAMYWLAAQGDRISAPAVGLVGSIGAIVTHENWEKAAEQIGLSIEVFKFGEHKDAGAWFRGLSDDEKADIQAEIDQIGRDFVAAVETGRPQLTAEALIGTEARVFMAQHDDDDRSGLAIGFVDAIETEQQAFEALLAEISEPAVTIPVTSKESTMAATPKTAPKAAVKTTTNNKPKAEAENAPETVEDPEPEDDEVDPKPADEQGDEVEQPAPSVDEGEGAGASEAAAIAASTEAKIHPQAALAAISNGLSLKQFKGMVAASAPEAAHRRSALRDSMAGVQRVGADAPGKTASSFGAALKANAQKRAGK